MCSFLNHDPRLVVRAARVPGPGASSMFVQFNDSKSFYCSMMESGEIVLLFRAVIVTGKEKKKQKENMSHFFF